MSLEQAIPVGGALALLVLFNAGIFWRLLRKILGIRRPSQRRRERSARRVIAKLPHIPRFEQKLAYLRKIDPFVFEEAILEAFEQRGQRVRRNERYSGDGGIDGQVEIAGKRYIIQAKRYRNHINARHMRDFCALVDRHECWGIFIHTGRTGKLPRALANGHDRVSIVSGRRLIKLLTPLDDQTPVPEKSTEDTTATTRQSSTASPAVPQPKPQQRSLDL
ncbi:restriction endonuclease [Salinicola sp. NYA28a]